MGKEIFGIDASVLRELKNLFKETSIEEIEMEEPEKFYIRVSRKKPEMQVVQAQPVATAPVVNSTVDTPVEAPQTAATPSAGQYDDESKYYKIKSPVIGTFYEASSPGAPPFVKIGDVVSPDTTVCIVEAMKVMNEIKAEVKGKIVQVLKNNEDPVQSDEVLFIVEKL